MTVTTTTLTRAAGLAAVAGGLLFVGVQINHPPLDVALVTTTEWTIRQTAKVLFAALSLAGITGMYLRQVKQTGVLGLLGYLLFGAGFLILLSIEIVGVGVLPALAHTEPGYVDDVLTVAAGGTATGDVGLLAPLSQVAGGTYLAGGLLFGIALLRAGALAPLAILVLPQINERLFAVPTGIAPGRPRLLAVARAAHLGRSPRAQPRQLQPRRLAARSGRRNVTGLAARSTRSIGWVPLALVAIVLILAVAGALRLVEVFGGPPTLPPNPGITASPAPVVVHIVGAVLYAGWGINLAVAEYVIRRHTRAGTATVEVTS